MSSKTLVIGSRWNTDPAPYAGYALKPVEWQARFLYRAGALKSGSSASRLSALGLTWDWAMNIGWPGKWRRSLSRKIASAFFASHDADAYSTIVLLGNLVHRALGLGRSSLSLPHWATRFSESWLRWSLDEELPVNERAYLLLPHTSGMNRWWNDPVNEATAREAVELANARRVRHPRDL